MGVYTLHTDPPRAPNEPHKPQWTPQSTTDTQLAPTDP